MHIRLLMLVVVLAALAGSARAGVMGNDRIELRPPAVTIERLEPSELAPERYVPPLPIERVPGSFFREWRDDDEQPVVQKLRMPELGPEGLDLEMRFDRVVFKVGADMVDGNAHVIISPRLDCDSRATYFWVRLAYDLDEHFSVYCESFQAADSILGFDTVDAFQRYVWDGFQLQPGVVFRPNDRVTIQGGPIFYVLSASRQPESMGGRIDLRFEF